MLTKIGQEVLNLINVSSYWICMFIALTGQIAYIIGFKKGIKYTVAATVVFVFITMLL